MTALRRSVASLRVSGIDLIPEEITNLLGASPTKSYAKGDDLSTSNVRTRIAKNGTWQLHANATEPEDFNLQVAELFHGLTDDLKIWSDLACRFKVDIFCGWFMQEGNEGVDISPSTLLMLGERSIALAIDIYGPDDKI